MKQNLYKSIISPIFEKDEQGNYAKDALLCQDIIHYYLTINGIDKRFKLRELQEWLVKNNREIIDYYQGSKIHTKISNRIHAKEGRINSKFENLLALQLIRGRIAENNQSNKSLYIDARVSYEYTKAGIFLALIIESMNVRKAIDLSRENDKNMQYKKLNGIYMSIYDILCKAFKSNDSASNIFYFALFRKLNDKGLIYKFVEHVHHMISTDKNIINMIDLLECAFYELQSQNEIEDIMFNTIEELDPDIKKLIIYRMKMFTEKKFENRKEDLTKEYEEFRFQLRNDYKLIAVQGYCENCKKEFNLTLYYKDLLYNTANEATVKPCPGCKGNLIYFKD